MAFFLISPIIWNIPFNDKFSFETNQKLDAGIHDWHIFSQK